MIERVITIRQSKPLSERLVGKMSPEFCFALIQLFTCQGYDLETPEGRMVARGRVLNSESKILWDVSSKAGLWQNSANPPMR
ncbi:MAG TPA: hypothetical protein VMW25_03150 [Clostridia bacterium]|nr:hypothetical protein [Clostridia bacterium]